METEKKTAHFRVIVRDENTEDSKSFPIYDKNEITLEMLIDKLKKYIISL